MVLAQRKARVARFASPLDPPGAPFIWRTEKAARAIETVTMH
jgi:hypothetical protein